MKKENELYRAAANFVAAWDNWKRNPDMRRRNHMVKRRHQLRATAKQEAL